MKQLKARELTLEFKNIDTLDELELIKIHSTLRSLKNSLKRQLKQYPEWDETIRVQAVILCTECSKDKAAQVQYQSSKNIRITRCLHLTDAGVEVDAKD